VLHPFDMNINASEEQDFDAGDGVLNMITTCSLHHHL